MLQQKIALLPPGFYLTCVLVLIIGGFWITNQLLLSPTPQVTNYQQCTKSPGSKILLTYPSQCVTSSGQRFTESPRTQPTPTKMISATPTPTTANR